MRLTVNLGFVATSAGVVVINSGPSYRVAQMLHRAIQRVSSYPVRYVVNTGADPANWLGNNYFKSLGVPLLAHEEARKLMDVRGADQLKAMQALLREKAFGTELALPRGFSRDTEEIRFSDSTLQLSYFGPAQSAGDIAVWLPGQKIAFTGAIMQSDALPELTADSHLTSWITAYDSLASLRPRQIIPGRGRLGDLTRMDADTPPTSNIACRDRPGHAARCKQSRNHCPDWEIAAAWRVQAAGWLCRAGASKCFTGAAGE